MVTQLALCLFSRPAEDSGRPERLTVQRGRVRYMLQDLAALAPPFIVCVAFLVGVGALVRRELAPRRAARREGPGADGTGETVRERREGSQT